MTKTFEKIEMGILIGCMLELKLARDKEKIKKNKAEH